MTKNQHQCQEPIHFKRLIVKIKASSEKKLSESRRVMFIFGALIGLILAALFTTNSESFTRDLDKLVNLDQFSDIFDDWKDLKNLKGLLPNGIQSFYKIRVLTLKMMDSMDQLNHLVLD